VAAIRWNGAAAQAAIRKTVEARIRRASMFLSDAVKADVSQPGTLVYNKTGKKGQRLKAAHTIYNFTHSRPGMPPFKQTGHLRRSITWEVDGLVGRVGSNLDYALALELGTHDMAARPFLLPNLFKHWNTLAAIVRGETSPGSLPAIESNQSRSGHLGAGGKAAGF
jgi:phage gpG-like protein